MLRGLQHGSRNALRLRATTPFTRRQSARYFSLVGVYAVTTDLLSVVHASGVPWALAIPITTFAIKSLTMTITHLWLRPIHRDADIIRPYTIAQDVNMHQVPGVDPSKREEWMVWLSFWEETARAKYRISKRRNFPPILTQIGVWLLMSDSFRYMLGMPMGILSRIYPQSLAIPYPEYFVDPSLISEGLFWCSSLAAPDPYYVLPLALGLIAYNGTKKAQGPLLNSIYEKRPYLARFAAQTPLLMLVGLSTIASQIPAGLVLYWATSAAVTPFITDMLAKAYPSRPVPKPCVMGFGSSRPVPNWILDPSAVSRSLVNKKSRS